MRNIVSICLITFILPTPAWSGQQLLAPDWTEAAPSLYLERQRTTQPGALAEPALNSTGQRFSLPVIGLLPDFAASQPQPETSARFVDPSTPAPPAWWPACARPPAPPTPVSDDTGTWYTLNYDFGCVFVAITGDRNSESEVPAGLIDPMSELRADQSSAVDEENDPNKIYSRTLSIRRFGIPYTVMIECKDESQIFCRDEAAQQVLLSRLSIVEGTPAP